MAQDAQRPAPEADHMQVLLSRAVEEQAQEQRLVSSLLTSIDEQLGQLLVQAQAANALSATQVAALLAAEREHTESALAALVIASETRVLERVEQAVLALATALLKPKRTPAADPEPASPHEPPPAAEAARRPRTAPPAEPLRSRSRRRLSPKGET